MRSKSKSLLIMILAMCLIIGCALPVNVEAASKSKKNTWKNVDSITTTLVESDYSDQQDVYKLKVTKDYQVRHFKEQLFTGYDVTEFEGLFREKPVKWITTAGVDGLMEPIEKRPDFSMTDEEFEALAEWYLAFSEKRELLGNTNHLLYICRKQA